MKDADRYPDNPEPAAWWSALVWVAIVIAALIGWRVIVAAVIGWWL